MGKVYIKTKYANDIGLEIPHNDNIAHAMYGFREMGAELVPYHYDADVLQEMMEAFRRWDERPMACSMDICVTKDGKTLLVEFNDAYALGNYGLPHIYYAKMISARWAQLLERTDEFDFRKYRET